MGVQVGGVLKCAASVSASELVAAAALRLMQEPERSSIERLEPDVHVHERPQVDRYAAVSRCVESRLKRTRKKRAEQLQQPRNCVSGEGRVRPPLI